MILYQTNETPTHGIFHSGNGSGWISGILSTFILVSELSALISRTKTYRETVQAHSAKAELLSARCFATPASKRNVPECRAKPNCIVSLNY